VLVGCAAIAGADVPIAQDVADRDGMRHMRGTHGRNSTDALARHQLLHRSVEPHTASVRRAPGRSIICDEENRGDPELRGRDSDEEG
jgi:hypothetical protein